MYYASEGKELVGCEALNHQQVVWLHRTTIAAFSLRGAAEAELLSLSLEFPTTVLNFPVCGEVHAQ